MRKLAEKAKTLPSQPGVYLFRNGSGTVIYVGKATSLKERVSSYFQSGRGYSRLIEQFIDEVSDLETRPTDTVLEAYLLEQELIKKLQPKYNAMGKDGKSFVHVAVTKEEFPRFLVLRKTDLDSGEPNVKMRGIGYAKAYGPYASKRQIEIALKILRKIFPYHSRAERSEKGCLDRQIGLCPGPYDGSISRQEYLRNIRSIRLILEGKKTRLIAELEREMEAFAGKEDFERAADRRNKLFALRHIQDIALISKKDGMIASGGEGRRLRIEAYDISDISGRQTVGSMVVFGGELGRLESDKGQYRKFRIRSVEGANDVAAMEEVLRRRFRNAWQRPDLLVLDGGRGHLNMARRALRSLRLDIPLLAVAKGPTRKKLDRYAFGSVPAIDDAELETIREEAHRFAIGYHRSVRRRELLP